MYLKLFLAVICMVPGLALGATRGDAARVGVGRGVAPGVRASGAAPVSAATANVASAPSVQETGAPAVASASCRDAYRDCMNEFCLLDESEGMRCACSDNINQSKSLLQEIQKIQAETDKLFTEGVNREKLTTRERRLLFGESEAAKKSSRASGLDLSAWLNSGDSATLDSDEDIGDTLYSMASEYCADRLAACGNDADMEEMLYARQIVQDCKDFSTYLSDLKRDAESNKLAAQAAVRAERLKMLDTNNKYNQGECLLAYRACVSDKGGCGVNFENCLDAKLLANRAKACEDILDQCDAVRTYVLQDWELESKTILADAAKYVDQNKRATCLAKIQLCLEESCATSTNSACLTDVQVAAGVCPIITECNEIIPGIQSVVNDKLAYLRTKFCENDVDKCLQDKCGKNYDGPECLGKPTSDIVKLCPQAMFPSCKGEKQYDIIVSSALLQMDYQMLVGCLNQFSEQLNRVCGTDMSCLPSDDTVMALTTMPATDQEIIDLRQTVRDNSARAVDEFFAEFERDVTISACADSVSSGKGKKGAKSLKSNMFTSAKMIAEINAEARALRELETKLAELSRAQDVEEAQKNCYKTYKVEERPEDTKNHAYSYIRSVSFEPSLRNCHVCRMQQVCETGGMSKNQAGLQSAIGMGSTLGAVGTAAMPGWGTAIGTVVGGVAGFFGGRAAGGKQTFCQEIESCEDINM